MHSLASCGVTVPQTPQQHPQHNGAQMQDKVVALHHDEALCEHCVASTSFLSSSSMSPYKTMGPFKFPQKPAQQQQQVIIETIPHVRATSHCLATVALEACTGGGVAAS